jgi:FKBP-type peptidyl-prolyl cis-trans isomerase FklB
MVPSTSIPTQFGYGRVGWRLGLGLLAGCGGGRTRGDAAGSPTLDTADQRASYGIGQNVGRGIARQGGIELDHAAFAAGLRDGFEGRTSQLDEAAIEAAFDTLEARLQGTAANDAETNLAAAAVYLEKNRARTGVTTTASGLQYEVLRRGDGPKPTRTDRVEVHYHGTLTDGTVFDSSVERGQTIEFPVTGVIQGWIEALQLMSVGDKWRLYIPPALGYGPRAAGRIPPNSALIFEVELIAIK